MLHAVFCALTTFFITWIHFAVCVDLSCVFVINYRYLAPWYGTKNCVFIPHATSCGGYNVFDPSVSQSVSQSVSPVFLVSTTPLKPLNRISWNFVVMKDIMCRCAYPQEILIPLFFLGVTPFLNLEIWPKWKILLNTVC